MWSTIISPQLRHPSIAITKMTSFKLPIQSTFVTLIALIVTLSDLCAGQHATGVKLVKCYQCHDGKVKLTHESQDTVLRAVAGSGSR